MTVRACVRACVHACVRVYLLALVYVLLPFSTEKSMMLSFPIMTATTTTCFGDWQEFLFYAVSLLRMTPARSWLSRLCAWQKKPLSWTVTMPCASWWDTDPTSLLIWPVGVSMRGAQLYSALVYLERALLLCGCNCWFSFACISLGYNCACDLKKLWFTSLVSLPWHSVLA